MYTRVLGTEGVGLCRRLHGLDQYFVHGDVGWLRECPYNCGSNIAGIKPQISVLTALCELGTSSFIGGAGGDAAVSVSRLDARDFDAAASAFLAQALAEALYKELCARVPEHAGESLLSDASCCADTLRGRGRRVCLRLMSCDMSL